MKALEQKRVINLDHRCTPDGTTNANSFALGDFGEASEAVMLWR